MSKAQNINKTLNELTLYNQEAKEYYEKAPSSKAYFYLYLIIGIMIFGLLISANNMTVPILYLTLYLLSLTERSIYFYKYNKKINFFKVLKKIEKDKYNLEKEFGDISLLIKSKNYLQKNNYSVSDNSLRNAYKKMSKDIEKKVDNIKEMKIKKNKNDKLKNTLNKCIKNQYVIDLYEDSFIIFPIIIITSLFLGLMFGISGASFSSYVMTIIFSLGIFTFTLYKEYSDLNFSIKKIFKLRKKRSELFGNISITKLKEIKRELSLSDEFTNENINKYIEYLNIEKKEKEDKENKKLKNERKIKEFKYNINS